MRIPAQRLEDAVMDFAKKAVDTLPTTGHKFVAGIMLGTKTDAIKTAMRGLVGEDGMVDADKVSEALRCGLRMSGDAASFTVGSDDLAWALKPVTVTITAGDVASFIERLQSSH